MTLLRPTPTGNPADGEREYEAPKLFEIGGVYELTLKNGCKVKKSGAAGGFEFAGMSVSVSSC